MDVLKSEHPKLLCPWCGAVVFDNTAPTLFREERACEHVSFALATTFGEFACVNILEGVRNSHDLLWFEREGAFPHEQVTKWVLEALELEEEDPDRYGDKLHELPDIIRRALDRADLLVMEVDFFNDNLESHGAAMVAFRTRMVCW